jgi:plastocyanin
MLGVTLFGQTGHQGLPLSENQIFPHYVLGDGYSTEFVLLNTEDSETVTGTLYLFDTSGNPLFVLYQQQEVSQIAVVIPPGGVQIIAADPVGTGLQVGWALLEIPDGPGGDRSAARDVHGTVIFTNETDMVVNSKVGISGNRYESGDLRTYWVPVQVNDRLNVGVAVVNASAGEIAVNFRLKLPDGSVLRGSSTASPPVDSLAAGQQMAMFVPSFFPDVDFSDFTGVLEITAQQEGLVVAALLLDSGLLSSTSVAEKVSTAPETVVVTNVGFAFSPDEITINAGDTVDFQIGGSHNVVEVSEGTWNADGTTSNGGFSLPFGGGMVTLDDPGTYYYVCQPHVGSFGMKGKIIVN